MQTAEVLTAGIDGWLRAEVAHSRGGRNYVLDDYSQLRNSSGLAWDDSRNGDAQKLKGHYSRYNQLLAAADEDVLRTNDAVVGKFVLYSLMHVSGGFRVQSALQAHDQQEYESLRFGRNHEPNGASGVNIADMVESEYVGGVVTGMDFGVYRELQKAGNEAIYISKYARHQWFADNPQLQAAALTESDPPVRHELACQRIGLTLALSHIAMASTLRGDDLTKVPFMQPMSITDAQTRPLIYPLVAGYDYANPDA